MGLPELLPSTDALASWQHHHNWHRPHSGIGGIAPMSRLDSSRNNLLTPHTWSPGAQGCSRRRSGCEWPGFQSSAAFDPCGSAACGGKRGHRNTWLVGGGASSQWEQKHWASHRTTPLPTLAAWNCVHPATVLPNDGSVLRTKASDPHLGVPWEGLDAKAHPLSSYAFPS